MSGATDVSAQAGATTTDAAAAATTTQAAGTQATTTTQTAMGAAADASPDWLKGVEPDVAAWIKTKGYADGAAAAKAAYHAEKMIGANKIEAPKDGKWSPEALKALGVPEKADGYQIKRPEMPEGVTYDENFEKAMLPAVHAAGLPPPVVQALIEQVTAYRIQEMRNAAIQAQDAQKVAMDGLHAEFGQKTQQIINQASKAALALEKVHGIPGLIDHLNKTRMGDDPTMIRAFSKIGELMGEGVLIQGTPAGGALSPDQAKAAIPGAMAEAAYTQRDHPGHKAAVEYVQRLNQAAYPEPRT